MDKEKGDMISKTFVTSYSRAKADILTNMVPKEVEWKGVCNNEEIVSERVSSWSKPEK